MTKASYEEQLMLLAFKLSRLTRKQFPPEATVDCDLSMLQIQTLREISMGVKTMSEIADTMNMALPTATVLVEKLVKAELVTRGYDTNDRRVITLQMTQKGSETIEKAISAKTKNAKHVLSKLSEEDKASLLRILTNLEKSLQ